MSYHDEQMRKRCEESSTYPSSKGHIPTFHGPMFPCEKCKELEAAHAATLETLREVQRWGVVEGPFDSESTEAMFVKIDEQLAKARAAQKAKEAE